MKAKAKLPAGMSQHVRGIMGRTTVRYRDGRTKRETAYGKTVAEVADKLQRIEQTAAKLADPKKRPVGEFLASGLNVFAQRATSQRSRRSDTTRTYNGVVS